MSRSLTIAYKHMHAGNFTKHTEVWSALQSLESSKVIHDHLLLVERGPSGSCETVGLTYDRLREQLKKHGRVDIRDARDSEPLPIKYAVFEVENNVVNLAVLMQGGESHL